MASYTELLKGFVKEEWVEKLDFSTLEKVNGSYVSDDLRQRADDIIWRVRWGGDWLYVYLLIELQSTVDPWMAVRIMTYVGLLYQDLMESKQLGAGRKLPPILPMVLYNGEPEWTAATDISKLIAEVSGGLSRYQPQLQYHLLALQANDIDQLKNIFHAFFASIPNDWYRKNDIANYEGYYCSIVYCYFTATNKLG